MLRIRPAREEEVGLLSDLALRSKGYWGYDAEFLEACREELTITAERLGTESIWVAETAEGVAGFTSVLGGGEEAELMDFFVDPAHIGTGVGRALWDRTIEVSRKLGARRLRIEADPNAEGWYQARGARRVGEAASGSIPGRMLPLLELDLG